VTPVETPMSQDQKRRAAVLAILCAGYVLAFVPGNLTGAADVSMLSVFEVDEFSQFRALVKMTSPSGTAADALHQFIAYDYYYYGFPFFASSAAIFWPLRSIYMASGEPGLTSMSVLLLRELSPLFTALAISILVVLWTRLRSLPHMIALFAFLAVLPAVVDNNLWWHPDALLLLLIVATIAALSLDRARLGRWFYLAALTCGLATATKTVGLWFFAAVALHLFRSRKQHALQKLTLAAAGFVATMLLAIAAASPHFFLPSEWEEILAATSTWKNGIDAGWSTKGQTGFSPWAGVLRQGFGWVSTWLALLTLGCVTACRSPRREHRDLAVMILAWVTPLSVFLVANVALHAERYLLPILLPLASCAGSPLLWRSLTTRGRSPLPRVAASAMGVLLCAQLGSNLQEDLRRYRAVLEREENSPALAFWERFDHEVLSGVAPGTPLRIFRDPYIYVPPEHRFEVHLRWRSSEHADISDVRPDLVLLRNSAIEQYADPESPARSIDRAQATRSHQFYLDASNDAIPGYRRLMATGFAVAYGRVSPAAVADAGEARPSPPNSPTRP
jgi:hypothetical protein